MEAGRHYNQRNAGKKKIHFTECKILLDESEISILIDALDVAARKFKSLGPNDKMEIRESRIKNAIEDFHVLIRKLIAERKELRAGMADNRCIELFRVQIKAIKRAIEQYKEELLNSQADGSSLSRTDQGKTEYLMGKVGEIESKLRHGSLEIRGRNKIKREKEKS